MEIKNHVIEDINKLVKNFIDDNIMSVEIKKVTLKNLLIKILV